VTRIEGGRFAMRFSELAGEGDEAVEAYVARNLKPGASLGLAASEASEQKPSTVAELPRA
jgi:hypothetical protein